jgi:hypothetical protein
MSASVQMKQAICLTLLVCSVKLLEDLSMQLENRRAGCVRWIGLLAATKRMLLSPSIRALHQSTEEEEKGGCSKLLTATTECFLHAERSCLPIGPQQKTPVRYSTKQRQLQSTLWIGVRASAVAATQRTRD